jgi:alkylated DNA repair dioxygenase AlkB
MSERPKFTEKMLISFSASFMRTSKRPAFRKQIVLCSTKKLVLDSQNCLVLIKKVLPEEVSDAYSLHAERVERFQGPSAFGQLKPRKEVCYTLDGKPYVYSGVSHLTLPYPEHVKNIVPELLNKLREFVPDNSFNELSNGVDIVYSNEFVRGGSISAHSDDEKRWGLVLIYSLGQTRWLRVRRKSPPKTWYNVEMTHNSLVAMHGHTFQKEYTHQVDKLSIGESVGTRYSLNLRFV